jgi:hypothetical protein
MRHNLLPACLLVLFAVGPAGVGSDAEAATREGAIWALPNGKHLLQVFSPRASERAPAGPRGAVALVERFPVPAAVDLRTQLFPDRSALESHLLRRYMEAIPPPTTIPDHPPAMDCGPAGTPGAGPGGTVFSGPPRIFILLPSSGPSFMPVLIAGSNFGPGAIPHVNGVPSIALFSWSQQIIPLIGSIGVGFTTVPPAAPAGPGEIQVEYCGQRSNPFPFTKN